MSNKGRDRERTNTAVLHDSGTGPPPSMWDPGPELSPEDEKEALLYWKNPAVRLTMWLSRRWFGVLVLQLTLAAAAMTGWLAVTRSDFSSAQWAYSALFQSGAALIGLAAVVATVLWQQAISAQASLQNLAAKYANMAFAAAPGEPQLDKGGRSRVTILLGQLEQILDKPTRDAERISLEGTGLRSRSDVLLALSRWAYAASWYTGVRIPIPMMRAWFKKMGLGERHVQELLVGSIVDRFDALSLFELQTKLFSPANRILAQMDPGPTDHLVWDIVYEMLRDGVLHHVRRGSAFSRIARGPLTGAFFLYLVTILSAAAGMTVTHASWHSPWLLAASAAAGLCSAGVTLAFVWLFTTQR